MNPNKQSLEYDGFYNYTDCKAWNIYERLVQSRGSDSKQSCLLYKWLLKEPICPWYDLCVK